MTDAEQFLVDREILNVHWGDEGDLGYFTLAELLTDYAEELEKSSRKDAGEPDMEENKVREKLVKLIYEANIGRSMERSGNVADAILQSPDLRVTLVEPRYYVGGEGGDDYYVASRPSGIIAQFRYGSNPRKLADEYCDWLNSKEPK